MSLKYCVIYGSVREKRQGIKGALFIINQLKDRGHEVKFLDAKEVDLPFLDKIYKEFESGSAPENMEKAAATLRWADAFVIVTGEYNHGLPPALKNLLDHFQKEYFFKPSGIASYSAGAMGGVRAAMHIRNVLGELGMPSIPSIYAMPVVQKSVDEEGNALEEKYNKRICKFLDELEWYTRALKNERDKGLPY